ncbi:site-specific integrase [Chelativorans sp. YIM 93263]|uniref:site-specific integrase n=1 Tax=Chelativorans sp. YIM 93263 TaxID=2906648 RepID=UPI002377EAF9|nr:site-specific integrase [Chelativorans sp. YIM 93263]
MQVRFAVQCAPLVGKPLYRASLRTSDYRLARMRLSECLVWFHRMNESIDYPSLFKKNVVELRTYLQDVWPISNERLFARRNYEELLKNLNRRAQAAGCDPGMIEPDFPELLKAFVQQNVEAEAYLRKAERVKEYERGRADMQAAVQFDAVPESFRISQPVTQTPPLPSSPASTPPQEMTDQTTEIDPAASSPLFSEALAEYLQTTGGSADGRRDVELTVQFLIDQMGDGPVGLFTNEQAKALDKMLPEIPDRTGIPRNQRVSLSARYEHAQKYGWRNLKRLTEARLRNGYHNSLSKFFGWLIRKGYYKHPKPVFNTVSGKNLTSLERDAFEYDEVVKIFSQPLFQGCKTPKQIWQPGKYFVQSHLYWGYIILILHGMRIGEFGQLDASHIREVDGILYFDLRSFDPEKGRVPIEEVVKFKTAGSERVIPIHPLVLELGLLTRVKELKKIGCTALFPEWEPYPKPNGEMRWGQPITKSWQYLKKKVHIQRANVAAYSTRHSYAQFLDSTGISHRGRKLLMGHSIKDDMSARYGSKKRLSARDLQQLTGTSSPEIQFMTKALLDAKSKAETGELVVVKPWLVRANWSEFYQGKFK